MAILLVGGYGGMGQKIAERLAAKGLPLLIAGRNRDKAESFAASIGHKAVTFDATKEDQWQELTERWDSEGVVFEGAANLVGNIVIKHLTACGEDDYRECFEQNVLTSFLLLKYMAPLMAKNGGGNILLMSSVAARIGLPNHELIGAAKAAVEGLAVATAASFATKNVRVNALAPALVETPMSHKFVSSEEAMRASARMHPLGRVGRPEDVAGIAEVLLSPETTWVSGQIIGVDGGMSQLQVRR